MRVRIAILLMLFSSSLFAGSIFPCSWCNWRFGEEGQMPTTLKVVFYQMKLNPTYEGLGYPEPPNGFVFDMNYVEGSYYCLYTGHAGDWRIGVRLVDQIHTWLWLKLYVPGQPHLYYFSQTPANECWHTGDDDEPFREEDCNNCPKFYNNHCLVPCATFGGKAMILFPIGDIPDCNSMDFTDDGIMNFWDYATLAEIWLEAGGLEFMRECWLNELD